MEIGSVSSSLYTPSTVTSARNTQAQSRARIRRSEFSITLLHPPGYSYFSMLRKKLHWSEQPKVH